MAKKSKEELKKIKELAREVIRAMMEEKDLEAQNKKIQNTKILATPIEILNAEVELEKSYETELKEMVEEVKTQHKREWDITISDTISFFDPTLSYELSGYKPIDKEHGLDFDPSWFTETRDTYNATKRYCLFSRKTKAYADFWDEQYRRCRNGMTVNGYTITGDHYFFLNFYQLDILTGTEKAGGGRRRDFPGFFAELYKYFHYLELCKKLRKNCALMKARGVGFSEMDAALVANSYNSIPNTTNVVAAFDNNYLEKTLNKIWDALNFLNDKTDGGFFKLRLVKDDGLLKRASHYKIVEGQKIEEGWMSLIQGINADKPRKIRGDRTDLLFYEEGGSWPNSTKAFILGDALVGVLGSKFGIKVIGGTGGDSGPNLEGLRLIYENPTVYDILPFKHNYTSTGDYVLTGMFIPSFNVVNTPECMDSRGYTDPEKGKAYYDQNRAAKASDLKALITYIAEYCYTAEEAFSQEGDNKFNKVNIVQQLTRIRALHECPPIQKGSFNLTVVDNKIVGSLWIPSPHGKVQILERPLWEDMPTDSNGLPIEKGVISGEKLNNLYIAGIDGIDIGKALTSETTRDASDFAIIIYRRAFGLRGPQIVAVYKDRPENERDAYKIAMGLMMYYNAKANIEASRVSMLTWAKDKKVYNWFLSRPSSTYADISKRKISLVGTPATPAIINHQTDLIKDFTDDYCDDLWFEDILDELNRYSDQDKRKFDYVAAFGMVLLADEEYSIKSIIPRQNPIEEKVTSHLGYYIDDRGYRRYGVIPTLPRRQTLYSDDKYYINEYGIRSSDPRNYV